MGLPVSLPPSPIAAAADAELPTIPGSPSLPAGSSAAVSPFALAAPALTAGSRAAASASAQGAQQDAAAAAADAGLAADAASAAAPPGLSAELQRVSSRGGPRRSYSATVGGRPSWSTSTTPTSPATRASMRAAATGSEAERGVTDAGAESASAAGKKFPGGLSSPSQLGRISGGPAAKYGNGASHRDIMATTGGIDAVDRNRSGGFITSSLGRQGRSSSRKQEAVAAGSSGPADLLATTGGIG